MHSFFTIAKLVLFSTAWQLVSAEAVHPCAPNWDARAANGIASCQDDPTGVMYNCKYADCWTGQGTDTHPPPGNHGADVTYSDCYRYKGVFGKSDRDSHKVTVHAKAYYQIRKKAHVNVIGYETYPGTDPLSGYRCNDLDKNYAICPASSCTVQT
ncbi:uncharacterized protein MELLADRAFT_124201 [Melampsora larici-populina 98AG31]|uniref:Secreted protein n=1 Tax=Melampsora larici-populina (strain 98AG31 / pathotype 3-4-7) TaxID=747676 RepID=F4RK61_MELLP|nr:uncharacterized protein MELLADRAFT_124201 [Melampsora larici-populina 98AG31]EGG07239.1 secreted protein [Melampsora larici-populina 98AG31]